MSRSLKQMLVSHGNLVGTIMKWSTADCYIISFSWAKTRISLPLFLCKCQQHYFTTNFYQYVIIKMLHVKLNIMLYKDMSQHISDFIAQKLTFQYDIKAKCSRNYETIARSWKVTNHFCKTNYLSFFEHNFELFLSVIL